MSRRRLACLIVAVVSARPILACSRQQPGGPDPSPATSANATSAKPQGSAGSYSLSFLDTNGNLVSTLPVGGPELILKAHVATSAGVPAQSGAVTFQYCSLRGLPPHDITRADEAPKEACDELGTGSWANLGNVPVNAAGDAFFDFGFVQIPRTVGFRFRYSARGGTIASGISPSLNFT